MSKLKSLFKNKVFLIGVGAILLWFIWQKQMKPPAEAATQMPGQKSMQLPTGLTAALVADLGGVGRQVFGRRSRGKLNS